MKTLIKKLIKKLKELKILHKTSCLIVVFMLLFSTFSVSSFAAEDDSRASSVPFYYQMGVIGSYVLDSIADLLTSAQSVFFSPVFDWVEVSFDTFFVYTDDVIGEVSFVNPDSLESESLAWLYFDISNVHPASAYDWLLESYQNGLSFGFSGNDRPAFSMTLSSSSGAGSGTLFYYLDVGTSYGDVFVPIMFIGDSGSYSYSDGIMSISFTQDSYGFSFVEVFEGWSGYVGAWDYVPVSTGLNFFGTLSVLSVGISIVLLILFVVLSFLKLRY